MGGKSAARRAALTPAPLPSEGEGDRSEFNRPLIQWRRRSSQRVRPAIDMDAMTSPSDVASVAGLAERVLENVGRVIVGKREVVELLLVALLAEGHVLIEDVPGVGKTTLARAMARSIGGEFRRIQFTPDLLPTDIGGL